jgi:hypothetical protein
MYLGSRALLAGIGLLLPLSVGAETIVVKYRGAVDLAPFRCEWIAGSSVVNRLCYDPGNRYAIVLLQSTYYHYCGVPSDVMRSWRNAESKGHFFNAQVKGRFDCRASPPPNYSK